MIVDRINAIGRASVPIGHFEVSPDERHDCLSEQWRRANKSDVVIVLIRAHAMCH
jgi:hypothetical protein